MNKLFKKIAVAAVGFAMAIGVGVAVGSNTGAREARADTESFDLTTNTYTTGTNEVTWTGTVCVIHNSGTNATNYLGGDANNRTSSRFYSGNSLTITPNTGITISTIVFEATSTNYANTLKNSTWTNGTSAVSSTTVTITATNGSNAVSASVGGTCGFTSIVVTFSAATTNHNITYKAGTYGKGSDNVKSVAEGATHTVLNPSDVGISVGDSYPSYVFDTWKDGSNDSHNPGSTITMQTSDINLTAQWVQGIALTYDKNDGIQNPDTTIAYLKTNTATDVLPSSTFTRSDYVFVKWNESRDGSGTSYVPGDALSGTITISSAKTLYAIWEEVHEVTFDFTQIEGFSSWGNSYSNQHIVEYDQGTVTFAGAARQTTTISTMPVVKAADVIFVGDHITISEASFTLRQWSSEIKTVTLYYSTDGGETFTTTGISSNTFSIADNDLPEGTNAIKLVQSNTSNRVGIQSLTINYEEEETPVASYATVEFQNDHEKYYSGSSSASKYTFSTEHVAVKIYTSSDELIRTYAAGTGYTLTVNSTPLDATENVQTLSFANASPGNYPISVSVPNVGEGGAAVNNNSQSPVVNLVVEAKDTNGISWANEQTSTLVSYADKFHIDGTFTVTFNDGSTGTSGLHIVTDIYTGNSKVAENKIASIEKTKSSHESGYDVTNNDLFDGKSITLDESNRLAYSSSTSFFVEMYYKEYPGAKISQVISVVIPTLRATDANDFNYYADESGRNTYSTAATAVLRYDNEDVRTLASNEFTLSPASVTPLNTNNITVTVRLAANNSIYTTYTITPLEPATLNSIILYDNSGAAMTSEEDCIQFKAGETFKLFNSATQHESSDYFALVEDTASTKYYINTYADFTFALFDELVDAQDSENAGESITTSTYMKKSMNDKWVRATYTQGTSSVSFITLLDIIDATVVTYDSGNYTKITTVEAIETGDYLIVYSDGVTNYTFNGLSGADKYGEVDITDNKVSYSAATAKLAVHITKDNTHGYAIQVSATSDNNAGKYISGTSGSNVMNFSDSASYCSVELTSRDGGTFDFTSNTSVLSFNSNLFRFYKSTGYTSYKAVDLYKLSANNAVEYLKSVIDAYRLNNEDSSGNTSICDDVTSIYNSDYWKGTNGRTSVKTVFNSLSSGDRTSLSVQDLFGQSGKTYVDTYEMLIAKEGANGSSRISVLVGDNYSTTAVIAIISVTSLAAIGGYFFIRKKKEI